MRRAPRSEVLEELHWHFDRPTEAYDVMTEAERRQVVAKGFLTKDLYDKIAGRLPAKA